jgi:sulfatase maturation enzyme AslB (radical SAM superfamily)
MSIEENKPIFLRREWFGGIIGDAKTYDLYLMNNQAFREMSDFYQNSTAISSRLRAQLLDRGINLNSKCRVINNVDSHRALTISAPITLWIEITNKCNSSCIHCFRKSGKNADTLSTDKLVRLINEAYEMGVFRITITGGEPLLHNDFNAILCAIKDTGMNSRVFTGSALNDSQLKRIDFNQIDHLFVSLDGGEEHDNLLRGSGAFNNMRKLLDAARSSKYDMKITLSFTIDNHNCYNFNDIIMLAKQYEIKSILTRPLFGIL